MRRAEASKLLPERLQHYLSERILVSSWYPEVDALEIYRVFAELHGGSEEVWLNMGRSSAIEHAHHTYQHLIESRDIGRLLQQANVLFRAMHDHGTMRTNVLAENRLEVTLEGYPVLCPEWTRLLAGYLDGLIVSCGGKTNRSELLEADYARKTAKWLLEFEVVS
ncbi:MAG: hypothetical protein R3B07_02385 [Polyangiaceae bacterium]